MSEKTPLLNRRRVLAAAVGTLGVAGLGFGYSVRSSPHPHFVSFDEVLRWLNAAEPSKLTAREGWSAAKALAHCAQSIELSITGFPEVRSSAFRATVGPTVFHIFGALGGMRHDLESPIPAAPPIAEHTNEAAIQRLRQAIARFSDTEKLKPHFAYGALNHADYEQAHAMHISEHLSRLTS